MGQVELSDYLFVLCEFASSIKYIVLRWTSQLGSLPLSILEVFELFQCLGHGKKTSLGLVLI